MKKTVIVTPSSAAEMETEIRYSHAKREIDRTISLCVFHARCYTACVCVCTSITSRAIYEVFRSNLPISNRLRINASTIIKKQEGAGTDRLTDSTNKVVGESDTQLHPVQ